MKEITVPKSFLKDGPTIDTIWPTILQAVYANPKITNRSLFRSYGHLINCKSEQKFIALMDKRGIAELRAANKNKTGVRDSHLAVDRSKNLTKQVVEQFKAERDDKGILFLGEMDKLVEKSVNVVKKQADIIDDTDNSKLQAAMLPDHLDNLNKVMKLGKEVYNLNKEASIEDKAKHQINILMHFDPMKHRKDAVDIQSESVD